MPILRITLNINGYSKKIDEMISNLKGKYLIYDKYQKGDQFKLRDEGVFQSSEVSIIYKKEFDYIDKFYSQKNWYANFIEKNYNTFLKYRMNNFSLFIEVYVEDNEQCNFEIFDKVNLKKLSKYNVSIPLSIYVLDRSQMNDLEGRCKTHKTSEQNGSLI